MPSPPESTKDSLRARLSTRARQRWPQTSELEVRFRGTFAYVQARPAEGEPISLMRLRYGGSASLWGFAIYLASKNGYRDSVLPNGDFVGTPEDALDCACGLYFNDPSAWI